MSPLWRCSNGLAARSYIVPCRRRIFYPVSQGHWAIPYAGAARGIHARQALARAWGPRCGGQARHQPSTALCQDRHGLPRLWPADLRADLGGKYRPDAGGQTIRAGQGIQIDDLRPVVDQGGDPGIHPALVVAGEDGHHRQSEEAVLQPAKGQEQDLGAGGRRPASGPGQAHRQTPRRHRAGRRGHELPPPRRRFAEYADPRGPRFRRVAGLAPRRDGGAGGTAGGGGGKHVSLNTPIREDHDSGEWQDWLVDETSDQETRLAEEEQTKFRLRTLGGALSVLNKREQRIFEARRLAEDPITLEDLAVEFGVSRERVRQIEARAFDKVQKAVKIAMTAIEVPPDNNFAIH